MRKRVFLEDNMEEELIKRGYNIFDDERCIDSSKVCHIACDWYGFETEMNDNGVLIFTGNF